MHLAGLKLNSTVDGNGVRMVIFFQGCPHNCKGCHNPLTHEYKVPAPMEVSIDTLFEKIEESKLLSGVTFSGGEPISPQNFEELLIFSKLLKEKYPEMNIWCYTGYTIEEAFILYPDFISEFSKYVDVFVDGPFIEEQKDLTLSFRGSRNQRILHTIN